MVTVALAGLVIAGIIGAILPSLGYQHEHVMGGGFGSLLAFVVYLNFCPSCSRKTREPSTPLEGISPQSVFIFTACLGLMLGGLIGGALTFYTPTLAMTRR